MPATYRLIKAPIPLYHNFNGGVIYDHKSPFIYIASRNPSSAAEPWGYFYKYNRNTLTLDLAAPTITDNGVFGPCALDQDSRLYYSPATNPPPGRLHHAAFKTEDLTFTTVARRHNPTTGCQPYASVSGGYVTPPPECDLKVWWHYDNSDLFAGSVDCFAQEFYCPPPEDPERKSPKFLYFVPQTAFDVPGGFSTNGTRLRAVAPDGAANLWVYFSGAIIGTGEIRHQLWVVHPITNFENPGSAVVEFKLDLAPHFLRPQDISDGRMRWFADDNSLIICNGYSWIKYDIGSGTVTRTLNTFNVPGRIPAISNTNQVSFTYVHPFVKSIWLGSFATIPSVPVPPGGQSHFPHFMEVRMTDLTVGRILTCTEIGVEYPPTATGGEQVFTDFLSAHEAILDPFLGEIWCTTGNRCWLAAFQFTDVPPGEGVPPGEQFPPGQEPFCVPRNKDFDPRTHGSI